MTEIDETVREFLVESLENLDRLDQKLITLEDDPGDAETINHIFRIVHTVKGTCGFFEFHKLEAVSHVGENLLDSLRNNSVPVTSQVITALLQLGDALRTMLSAIEQTGTEGAEEYLGLQQLLSELNTQKATTQTEVIELNTVLNGPHTVIERESESNVENELEMLFREAQNQYLQTQAPDATGEISASKPSIVADDTKKSEIAETALRVDINLLDKLMNLVGELVLARNQILQFTKNQSNSDFASTSQRLNLITSELQEGVMRTRMQPIANVWNKLPRVVRDVATSCGKQVRLEMFGKETELDKTIIEAIKDPLTHIIRNAVDHGIEGPAQRAAAKKNPEGVLSMKAFHEGGQVIIEIADDGAGLNVERIKQKAVDRGIVTGQKVARMTEQEIQRLIFLPGFSTAEKVTNISGRGVGMDVVRSNIERIGGTVDVSSVLGRGTSFTIKIPLTLAIIPALIATAGGNRYAIPQVNLLELVRIEGEQIRKNLEEVEGALFYRLRGKLLPIIRLRDELKLNQSNAVKIKDESVLNIVVVRADNHQFGLIVDAIYDTEEIVVKPLGKLLKQVTSFAGATIMGDGRVALILDVVGLARNAKITKEMANLHEEQVTAEASVQRDKRKLLIFQLGDDRRAAIPLEAVHRLEEFETAKLERAAGRAVVQYRDGILPLIDLQEALCGITPSYNGAVRAFVHGDGDRYVGFVVKQILDIVEQSVKVEKPYQRPGLIGSAIIQGTVTDLIDLNAILNGANVYTGDATEGTWNS